MKKIKRIIILFLPYALCVIMPIVSVILLSRLMLNSYEEKIEANMQISINRAFEDIQKRFKDVEKIVTYIGNSELTQRYVYTILRNKENIVTDYLEIIELMKLFEASSDVVEIYLYDSRENRIITTEAMLSDAEDFFKYGYRIAGKTAEECIERLKSLSNKLEYNKVMLVTSDGDTMEAIECSMNVPFILAKNYPLQLVVTMEAEDIFGDLYEIVGMDGEFYVYDQSGNSITGKGNQYEAYLALSAESDLIKISDKGETLYGTVMHSKDNNYKLKVYIPDLHEDSSERWYVLMLMMVSMIVSVGFCIYFTIRNQREIEEIMAILGYRADTSEAEVLIGNSYGYIAIKKNVDRLVRENAVFIEQVSRLNELKKYQILNKLLYDESGEMLKNQSDLTAEIKDDKNLIFCIRYESADYRSFVAENVTVKDLVKMFLKDMIDREIEMFDPVAKETICVIYGVDTEHADILMRDIVAKLNVEIFLPGGITAVMGVSNVVETIYDLNEAYNQAKAVINYRKITGKNILMYSELLCLSDDYYYPKEWDELLNNYVIAGKCEEVKRLLERLYRENSKKMLTIEALDKIRHRLMENLKTVAEQYDISIQETCFQIEQEKNIEKYFTMLYLLVDVIAEGINSKKSVLSESVVSKILDYINVNYADSSLSLNMIAHELGFQKDYISKLFKEEYGENLFVVIERIRIEKACELLKNTNFKIVDVSKSVGYNSDISFRRAFKKVTGLTPVEYKNM